MRLMRRNAVAALVVAGWLMVGARARAQVVESAMQAGRIPIPYRTYIGIDPLIIPFDLGSVEVESGIAQGITVGGNASYIDFDDDRYTSGDLKLRYYPGEVVLRGFSLGLTGGFLRYSTVNTPTGQRDAVDAPTVGVVTDYNWMLGGNKRFVVGTGLGAKRVLLSRDDRDRVGLSRAYVTGRFIVGLAF